MKPAEVCRRLLFALAVVLAPVEAGAQTRTCVDRATLLERFGRQFDEQPIARALMNTGGILEILSTGDGSTWTLVVTMPSGTACIVAAGQYWQIVPAPLPGDEL